MCRLFAYLDDEPLLLKDVIWPRHAMTIVNARFILPVHTRIQPFLRELQVGPLAANDACSPDPLTNMNGFGAGCITTSERDSSPCSNSKSDVCCGDRCHAFVFGRHLFANNGILVPPPRGTNRPSSGPGDVEHISVVYFFILMGKDGNWESSGLTERELSTLKLVAMSGSSPGAMRYGRPKGLEPLSLYPYYSRTAGERLHRKYKGLPSDIGDLGGGEHTWIEVASEPSAFNQSERKLMASSHRPSWLVAADMVAGVHVEHL
ncbi:hypothetical protein LX36DRAFT_731853 [Colletotrichum falcatum]|nr:hypothetical protein LX36DRAFT_731853 [Colletotrichum falcatum]